MGFLDKLKTYGEGSWTVKSTQPFSAAEARSIKEAAVIEDSFGRLQVCFTMVSGGTKYGALSTKSSLVEGQMIDPNSLIQIELQRDNDLCYKFDGKELPA